MSKTKTTNLAVARRTEIATSRSTATLFSLRAIHLYDDGTIESPWGSGSVRGANAHVDQGGNRKLIRDFRSVTLAIEGPYIAIALPLEVKRDKRAIQNAQQFAAEVNRMAARLAEAE
jgi:hypothetical protein